MTARAAGYSSEEENYFGDFSSSNEAQIEMFEEKRIEASKQRRKQKIVAPNEFFHAIMCKDIAVIKEILDTGFGVDFYIYENWTPLILASFQPAPDIVIELLERGASPNTRRNGTTCLMAVCSIHRNKTTVEDVVKVVSKLIEHGADIVATDHRRRTALMYACEQGFLEVVNILLPFSDIEAADNQGWTALFYAVHNDFPKIVEVLLENGSNPYVEDIRSYNAKHYAHVNDSQIMLDLLPKDIEELLSSDYNDYFENDFVNFFEQCDRPKYYRDMDHLLYGMDCVHLIPLFKMKHVDIETLLLGDDAYLKEIGVSFTANRKRIYQSLHRFHRYPWKATSLPLEIGKRYSTMNILETLGNAIKHAIVMRTSVKFILNNFHGSKSDTKSYMVRQELISCLNRAKRIKMTLSRLNRMALMYESDKPADFIKESSSNIYYRFFCRAMNYFPFCYFFNSQ